jgi:hypothetical protein
MHRPLLSVSGVDPFEYYQVAFERDLRHVISGTEQPHVRLSVASQCLVGWARVVTLGVPTSLAGRR